MAKKKSKLEMRGEISTLFCEMLNKQLGVVTKKVTTLIYNNKIIAFTTHYLTEQIQGTDNKGVNWDNQRKHELNKLEHYKPYIKKEIEKRFDCNVDQLDFFVGTNGIYLVHITLCET